ncbi:MAG: hypothetical protein L6427_00640 [Actinomycetia bacterium]|nr:hypothetical protein [Actinomycetes bacterium]
MEEKIWYKSYAPGVPRDIDFEKVTISRGFTRAAKRFPDNVALNLYGEENNV